MPHRACNPFLFLLATTGIDASAFAGTSEDPAPIEVAASYTADVWTVVEGANEGELRYLDDASVSLAADGERLLGWRGAQFYAQLLYNNGEPFSDTVLGDTQVVSNIETGVRALRLYEAWVQQRLSQRVSLRFGLYDLNSEFDVNETGSLFLNSSHGIGPDFSQSGENGPSIFPSTALALRAELAFAPGWRARAAILDAVPGDPDRPKRTAVRLREREGALLVAEIERRWTDGRVAFGHWTYSEAPLRLDGSGRARSRGTYLIAEHRLIGGVESDRSLSGWIRLGLAEPRVHPIASYFGAGLVLEAPFPGRGSDAAGIALAWARFGRTYRRLEDKEAGELNIELTYRFVLTEWLAVQPDLQLVFDPSGTRGRPNALAFGIRTEIGF